ncbi:hypothetical protein D6C84_03146 [Aureobasidium pullulans]|uniref:Tafazzin family protein n=1 Tax=Aureobasidium pullulans TaxID=5580 RepID=A0A4S9XZD3_AURPU|nr:hypothetical protein D6C84_03146 [Aureobasidium pullulans]
MATPDAPEQPSLLWRTGSSVITGATGFLCRTFLVGLNRLEVHGYDKFMRLLDERADVKGRTKGLITVSNHTSVMDDPILWGVLPYRYHWNPDNVRWSLASHDLAFQNKFTSLFFSLGNTLPCHRLQHSPYGGLFQPTMTQAVRLLSAGPFPAPTATPASRSLKSPDISDPFSGGHLTYSTDGVDTFPAPSAYASRRHAWVHIFPEGRVHQKEDKTMRYFKWGVSRLILESEPAPDLVPLFIEGFDSIMHESRGFPRPIPRAGRDVTVTFGDKIDTGDAFRDLRDRWAALKEQAVQRGAQSDELGVVRDEQLMNGAEAVRLREECTMRVREAVLAVRRTRGLPDEDPKCGLIETWAMEKSTGEGKMADGSYTKDT